MSQGTRRSGCRYKIYAESFRDQTHLQSLLHEAQAIVDAALAAT